MMIIVVDNRGVSPSIITGDIFFIGASIRHLADFHTLALKFQGKP
jgi:hypothetical protein